MSEQDRQTAITLIQEACSNGARKHKACEVLEISVRTIERWEKECGTIDKRKDAHRTQANMLTEQEIQTILAVVNSKEYCDLPISKIVPKLADQDIYLASESTIYRILRGMKQLTHRLKAKAAKHNKPKSFVATGPNKVWSWDISYLPTTVKGMYFYLYLIVDIYSRKIVGWSIHDVQTSEFASQLVTQACLDEDITEKDLVLHSDNGKPMKGATMLVTLEKLGVTPSFSRPSVSDDNPYSESLFKTVKYHATYPVLDKFDTISQARIWMEKFVYWYNTQHLHSGIKFVSPMQRHSGIDKLILQNRDKVYQLAKQRTPCRWSRGTRNWGHDSVVTLNPGKMGLAVKQNVGNIL